MKFWIETDEVSARWDNVSEKEADLLFAYAALLLDDPDTLT